MVTIYDATAECDVICLMEEAMKSSHEFARQLLALPDRPVGVNYDGEYNAQPRDPVVCTIWGVEYVIFACGEGLPEFPLYGDEEDD